SGFYLSTKPGAGDVTALSEEEVSPQLVVSGVNQDYGDLVNVSRRCGHIAEFTQQRRRRFLLTFRPGRRPNPCRSLPSTNIGPRPEINEHRFMNWPRRPIAIMRLALRR